MPLPAFGQPSRQLRFLPADQPVPPVDDWIGDEASWSAFFDDTLQGIADHLWPRYDPATRGWIGGAAARHEEAARAELEIIARRLHTAGILERIPDYAAGDGEFPVNDHRWHYRLEDFARDLITRRPGQITQKQAAHERWVASHAINSYYSYDASFGLTETNARFGRMGRKYLSFYEIKRFFLRPRPQQAAFLLGVDDFSWEQADSSAHTGNHPAIISGHCAQGLLFGCILLEEALSQGDVGDDRLKSIGQFAVDFGDRRVFGGVHYLTDNIASWCLVLRAIPHVFEHHADRMHAFVHEALRNQSLCYRIIQEEFPAHAALAPALDYLNRHVAPGAENSS